MSTAGEGVESSDMKTTKENSYIEELRADERVLSDPENHAMLEKWLNGLEPLVRQTMIISLGIKTQPKSTKAIVDELDRALPSVSNYKKTGLESLKLLVGSNENDQLQAAVLRRLSKRKNDLKNILDIEISEPVIKASTEFKRRTGRPKKPDQAAIKSVEHDRAAQYDVPEKLEAYEKISFKETAELVLSWRDNRNSAALDRLTASHIRFIKSLAQKRAGYGLPVEDLVQEGVIGYMKALEKYDPDYRSDKPPYRGVTLLSYASHWINAEMNEYVMKNWQTVKAATTKDQRKLFFSMKKAAERAGVEFGVGLTDDQVAEICEDLNVSPKAVRSMESPVLGSGVHQSSVDQYAQIGTSDDVFDDVAEEEYLSSRTKVYHEGLQTLDARSRKIILCRWTEDKEDRRTLSSLADEFGISTERVRQIEKAATKSLKAFVKAAGLYGVQEERSTGAVITVNHNEYG